MPTPKSNERHHHWGKVNDGTENRATPGGRFAPARPLPKGLLHRLMFLLLVLPLGLVMGGCPKMGTYQTADPIEPGRWEAFAALEGMVLSDREQDLRTPTVIPSVGARRGLVRNLDAGLKVYSFGLDGSLRWRYLHRPNLSMALAPTLGYSHTQETSLTTKASHTFAHLPMLITWRRGDRLALTLGPRLFWGLYSPQTGGMDTGLMAGGLLNVSVRAIGKWHLVPELNLLKTLSGNVPVSGTALSFGLGLVHSPGASSPSLLPAQTGTE